MLRLSVVIATAATASACGAAARTVVVPAPVEKPAHLAVTRFVAFGDSMTEGFVQRCPGSTSDARGFRFSLPLFGQDRAQPSPTAYTVALQALLAARYPGQDVTVVNEGAGGEEIQTGAADLPRVLTTRAPQVLLLQEGINTINARHAEGIPIVVDNLRRMIREAKGRGVVVLVGTLLPQRVGGCRAFAVSDDGDDIVPANVLIRGMVGEEDAILVDLYQTFNGNTSRFIGEDGLHPNAAGYRAMADTFFAAIRKHLEG